MKKIAQVHMRTTGLHSDIAKIAEHMKQEFPWGDQPTYASVVRYAIKRMAYSLVEKKGEVE